MPRTFLLVLLVLLGTAIAGCKCNKPAAKKVDEAKAVEPDRAGAATATETAAAPAAPADPARPGDPAKPADPASRDDSAPDDPAATGTNTEAQNKGLAMMQRMSDLFVANAGDCSKLAAEIRNLVANNKELLAQQRADDLKLTGAQRTAYETRNRAVIDAATTKMLPVVKACRDNAEFMAVMRDAQPQ
jgi:hypothetical protein